MRKKIKPQMSLFGNNVQHKFSKEYEIISNILDANPQFIDQVYNDLNPNKTQNKGACGISAEQTLRAAILKQREELSYEYLAFQLEDSATAKAFVRLDEGETYSASCLQENIKKIREQTWDNIRVDIILYAELQGIEKGRTVKLDSTVVETDIHYPTDSSLLHDCVRVTARILEVVRKSFVGFKLYPKISPKKSKNLDLKIINAKTTAKRLPYYKELIKGCNKLLKQLPLCIDEINKLPGDDVFLLVAPLELTALKEHLSKILYQTKLRVLEGKTVPVDKKVVSVFEPHTDIILKGGRDVEFGHKVFFTTGKSNLVLDCIITKGNPSDSKLFMKLLNNQKEIYGKMPRQSTADGCFASADNVKDAKHEGVKDVCFSKRCGLEILDMVKSSSVFKKLRNLRAGIESVISALKRAFGLTRANWKGAEGFNCYVKSAVVAFNLTVLAKHLL